MNTTLQTVTTFPIRTPKIAPGTRELRRPRDRPRPLGGFSRTSLVLVALVLPIGGRLARAGEAGRPAPAPTAVERTTASTATAEVFSARSLVAQATADLAAGHPGLAILGYERARLLAPRATAVTAGLARAQSIAGLPPADTSPAIRLAMCLDADEWGWIGMAGLILAAASLVALSWGRIRRRALLALACAGAGVAGAGFLSAVAVTPPPTRAVVVLPDSVARIAPFAGAEPAFVATEGAVVTVERTFDHYTLIVSPDGRGWVPEAGVETILPATRKRS
jgi:hypothetical protein